VDIRLNRLERLNGSPVRMLKTDVFKEADGEIPPAPVPMPLQTPTKIVIVPFGGGSSIIPSTSISSVPLTSFRDDVSLSLL
jgi:hypothetical protein